MGRTNSGPDGADGCAYEANDAAYAVRLRDVGRDDDERRRTSCDGYMTGGGALHDVSAVHVIVGRLHVDS